MQRRALAALIGIAAVGLVASSRADDPAAGASVARVGDVPIPASALEKRIATTPAFQLRTLGSTAAEIRRAVLERPFVRDELLAQGARREKLDARSDVAERLRAGLRAALVAELRAEVEKEGVTDDEVKAHYDANRSKFQSPARTVIWRILCAKREDAVAVLDEMKKEASPKRWNELAHDKSIDKTSRERGGNLGFVSADGATTEGAVKVDPAVVAAAAQVADGELVKELVAEGDGFAVVWRRQSVKAVDRPLEAEAGAIKQRLLGDKLDKRVRELVEKLRKEHLKSASPETVDVLEITQTGDVQPLRRPGALPATKKPAAAPPKPEQGPNGLR